MTGFARRLRIQAALFKEAWDGGSAGYAQALYGRRAHSHVYVFYWSLQGALLGAPVLAILFAIEGIEQRWTVVAVAAFFVLPNVIALSVRILEPLMVRHERRALRRFTGTALPSLGARQWRQVWRRSDEVGRRRLRRARWSITLCAVAAVVDLSGYPAAVGLDLPWLPYVVGAVCLVLVARALRRRGGGQAAAVELVRATALRRRFDQVPGAEARLGGLEVAVVDLEIHERFDLGPEGPVAHPPVTPGEARPGLDDVVTRFITMRLWLALDESPHWLICVGDRIVAPLGLWT